MYIHPELGQRLAEAEIKEARSRAQRAPAVRAALLDRRTLAVPAGKRRNRWAAPMIATVNGWWARRRSFRTKAPRTTNG